MRIEAESPFLEEIAENLVYPEGSQGRSDEIARWKNLLATCTTNESKTRQLRAILSKELVARAKRYAELAHTLAEAIQFKSPLPLEQKYGTPEEVEQELRFVEPIDRFNASLKHWFDEEGDR
jgi:hypothetical protein